MGRHPTLELLAVFSHCSANHYLALLHARNVATSIKCIVHKHMAKAEGVSLSTTQRGRREAIFKVIGVR